MPLIEGARCRFQLAVTPSNRQFLKVVGDADPQGKALIEVRKSGQRPPKAALLRRRRRRRGLRRRAADVWGNELAVGSGTPPFRDQTADVGHRFLGLLLEMLTGTDHR